jgi:hypothetical protein
MTKHVVLWLAGAGLATVLGGGVLAREGDVPPANAKVGAVPDATQVRQRMSTVAVPFEANTGQQDPRVAFTAHTFDGTMFVTTAGQLVHSVYGPALSGHDKRNALGKRGPGWALTETLIGAHPVVRGGAASATHVNRFIGNDPSRWRTSIAAFDRVALGEAWPGITVELAARASNVEKFFTVAPGADARRIAVRLEGAERLELDGDGALVAHTGNGPVSFTAPRAWQDIKGERKDVRVAYTLAADRYGFQLREYDPAFAVVIDPLKQSTYLGGSDNDGAHAIAVDAASGNVFVTGYTFSQDLPVTTGAQQSGYPNAFVAAFDNTLTQAIVVTYLGGNGFAEGLAIKVDGTGNVFVAGPTTSTNFPVTAGVAQSAIGGGQDAFVAKLNSNLIVLAATYLGGGGSDTANAIALDTTTTNGNVFVTGYTTGSLPAAYLTGAAQPAYAGGTNDAFVARLDSNLTTITATYLGGGGDDLGRGIAFDANGYVFVTGQTRSTNFIGAQNSNGGSADAFVAKLATALTGSIQSTYFGGTGNDAGNGIAVNPANGDVFVAGDTVGNLPAAYTVNGAQPAFGGFKDAFVVKLNNNLTMPPINATYLGGSADDFGNAIALDAAGNVFVAGMTRSPDFPQTLFGLQSSPGGVSYENFVAKLNNLLTAPITQATYLGTGQEDEAPSLALDSNNYVFVAGHTSSLNFPGRSGGAFPLNAGGAYDAYVAKLTHGLHDVAHQNTPANDDGDPHITTTNGVHYNFQAAGEFTALRDLPGVEIQTRQSPTSTFGPFFDGYTGLTTCVSLNTAVAARVGKHRVTYQPNFKNPADPGGLQLRVDGVLTPLTTAGLNLSGGGKVVQTAGALEIDFPDGTVLIAVPGWAAPQWFLNIGVYGTEATAGIMGWIPSGDWLPALPNGTSLGPMPPPDQRYVALNQTFANAWRVSSRTSLFDYAPGTSTATFTFAEWPAEKGPCVVPDHPKPLKPLEQVRAQEICRPIADKTRNADCVFDVAATGVPGFAKAYLLSQRIEQGGTAITVSGNPTPINAQMNFTATVARLAAGGQTPTGTVQFMLNGEKMGEPVRLDARGTAGWKAANRKPGEYRLSARYLPGKDSVFLPSSSAEKAVLVRATR